MVIDNADDTQVFFGRQEPATSDTSGLEGKVGSYIPDCAHGSVLVTTRNKETGSRLAIGKRPIEAAAFIQENTIPVSEYLRLLGQSDQQLVDLLSEEFETVGRDSETSRAVTETWILSFEQIERQNGFASELLSLMSLFDRQAIPSVFLSHRSKQQDQEPKGEMQLTKALAPTRPQSALRDGLVRGHPGAIAKRGDRWYGHSH
ncbi:hypothetical protein GE09DRAFT_1266719 [Coniochaeta sp. 2T2.1]|nr:hypothetical protein GE09DRAFT_1266719 [Coniochaeta sp. 2T2.1]